MELFAEVFETSYSIMVYQDYLYIIASSAFNFQEQCLTGIR